MAVNRPSSALVRNPPDRAALLGQRERLLVRAQSLRSNIQVVSVPAHANAAFSQELLAERVRLRQEIAVTREVAVPQPGRR